MRSSFGITKDGKEVFLHTLKNSSGMEVKIMDYGASVTGITVPDKDSNPVDVVLGYDTLADYENTSNYFGTIVGRNCNRIENAEFTIDGTTYKVADNDHGNNLHNGPDGFDRRVWDAEDISDTEVRFTYKSPDMESGFPGNFTAVVTYKLEEDNTLRMIYNAVTDKPTIANLTSHTFYNLEGHAAGNIADHNLVINAKYITPVKDSKAIPTGELLDVAGTPFDFNTEKKIGKDIDADDTQIKYAGGYDHNYIVDGEHGTLRTFAVITSDKTGIKMELLSDHVGMQFYTGNFLTAHKAKGGAIYDFRQGFAMEPQFVPNSINDSHFESPVLRPGEEFKSETDLRFSIK